MDSKKEKPIQPDEQPTTAVRRPKSLVEFFRESPLAGIELDLKRELDYGREINT